MLLKKAHQREQYLQEMQQILSSAKKENRSFTAEEDTKFSELEKQVKSVDDELEKNNTNLEELIQQMDDLEKRYQEAMKPQKKVEKVEKRSVNPLEVRGYRGEERIGEHKSDIQIGDLIYSHITGKYRNEEVRAALATTSAGIVVPEEVYSNFIDKLRDESILSECTIYPMSSKVLHVPRLTSDIAPQFKVENELAVESTPIFDSVKLEARPLYAICPISLELIESSSLDMGNVITQLLASAMSQTMQEAMLNGGWVNGYEGILSITGVHKITGDVSYATIGEGVKRIRNNNGQPNAVLLNNFNAIDLQLATDTTGQYITPPVFMEQLKQYELNSGIFTNNAMVADLSSIAWGILSEGGLQIEIDRYGDAFNRGQVKIRARINCDFTLTNPWVVSHILPTA